MKKRIDKKLYDTDTALKIASWEELPGDFSYICETLYRKRSGEYFLHGEGGPRSMYGIQEGSNFRGGATIVPLTYEQAEKWAEEHAPTDVVLDEFGCEEDDEDDSAPKNLNLLLSPSVLDKLEFMQRKRQVSKRSIIEELIEKEFSAFEKRA